MSNFNDVSGTPSPDKNNQASSTSRRVGMYNRPESAMANPIIMIVFVLLAIAAIVAALYFLKVF